MLRSYNGVDASDKLEEFENDGWCIFSTKKSLPLMWHYLFKLSSQFSSTSSVSQDIDTSSVIRWIARRVKAIQQLSPSWWDGKMIIEVFNEAEFTVLLDEDMPINQVFVARTE